jgi:hypothetical protein
LDRKGLQFFYVYVAVFRERNHHRGDALAVLLVCSAYANSLQARSNAARNTFILLLS